MHRADIDVHVFAEYRSCYTYQSELHVALVSPPVAPGVSDDPVPFINVHSYNVDTVVDGGCSNAAREDAALVRTPNGGVNNNCKRATSQDVIDHFLLSPHREVVGDRDCEVPL